jgi:hypothetical protein
MLAFVLLPLGSAMLAQVRSRLGVLPALWRIETDVTELESYLTRPKAFLELAGPDCECIGKNQKGPDCECLGKAKADVAALAKMKTQVENMDIHDLPNMLAMLKSMYGRFETNIKDAAKLEEDASAAFKKKEATMTKEQRAAAETERKKDMQRFASTLSVAKEGMQEMSDSLKNLASSRGKKSFLQVRDRLLHYCKKARSTLSALKLRKKGPDCACIGKTQGPDCECIGKTEKKGPDCACIGKTQGPDCECIGAKPKTVLLKAEKKGPDCACIGKTQGPDCECIGKTEKKGPDCACIGKTQGPDCECIGAKPKTVSFVQLSSRTGQDPAPEDQLAKEMTHDLEMNFNKIAPFGKEDTAKELQDHAADTQDTLVDAVENAEVAEIKRAVFRALTRLRAATIKEFDTIARLETQAIDAYNDAHHYRAENPLSHLHEDEAPVETDKLKSFH